MDSLLSSAQTGKRLEALESLRDYLAAALDQTMSARDQASLSKQFMDCLSQIEEMRPPVEEVDGLAELIPDV